MSRRPLTGPVCASGLGGRDRGQATADFLWDAVWPSEADAVRLTRRATLIKYGAPSVPSFPWPA